MGALIYAEAIKGQLLHWIERRVGNVILITLRPPMKGPVFMSFPFNEIEFKRNAVEPIECIKAGMLIKSQYWLFVGMTVVGVLIGQWCLWEFLWDR